MYYNHTESSNKVTLICLSIGIAFIKFCGIVIWSIVQLFPCCRHRQLPNKVPYRNIDEGTQLSQEKKRKETIQLRDSILDDSQEIPTY